MKDLINQAFQAALKEAEQDTLNTFLFELKELGYDVKFNEDMDISSVLFEINSLNRFDNEFTTVNFLSHLVNLIGEENA